MGWEMAWVSFIPPTSVGIVTENPLTGRKAKSALRCFRNINNNTKHFAVMALPLFNPLHHTWAISAPPRGPNGYFGLKQPLCRGEDYFAYFELAKIVSKSGKRLKQKAILSFLGDVGVKKWSQNFHLGTQSAVFLFQIWALLPKVPFFRCPKMALWVPKRNF